MAAGRGLLGRQRELQSWGMVGCKLCTRSPGRVGWQKRREGALGRAGKGDAYF